MDSATEALFRAMLTGGWLTSSNGSDDYGLVYGYARYEHNEIWELYAAFEDTIVAYGQPPISDIVGNHIVTVNSLGVIDVQSYDSEAEMIYTYQGLNDSFYLWLDSEIHDPEAEEYEPVPADESRNSYGP